MIWKETPNMESLGELYIAFFKYYSEDFLFDFDVVTIRDKKLLNRYRKANSTSCLTLDFNVDSGKAMAVEDPFDLSHNVARGVTIESRECIIQALRAERVSAEQFLQDNITSLDPSDLVKVGSQVQPHCYGDGVWMRKHPHSTFGLS